MEQKVKEKIIFYQGTIIKTITNPTDVRFDDILMTITTPEKTIIIPTRRLIIHEIYETERNYDN